MNQIDHVDHDHPQDALLRTVGVAEEVGVRALVVHAMTSEARRWYEQYGFEQSPTDPLHLILLTEDLKRLLEQQPRAGTEPPGSD